MSCGERMSGMARRGSSTKTDPTAWSRRAGTQMASSPSDVSGRNVGRTAWAMPGRAATIGKVAVEWL